MKGATESTFSISLWFLVGVIMIGLMILAFVWWYYKVPMKFCFGCD